MYECSISVGLCLSVVPLYSIYHPVQKDISYLIRTFLLTKEYIVNIVLTKKQYYVRIQYPTSSTSSKFLMNFKIDAPTHCAHLKMFKLRTGE